MAATGRAKTGGRKKGTPNRVTASVKEAILAAFEELGAHRYLVNVGRSDPRTFLALLGKLIPSEVRAHLEGSGLPKLIFRDYTGRSNVSKGKRVGSSSTPRPASK